MKQFIVNKLKKIYEDRVFSEKVIYTINYALNKIMRFEALRICTLTAEKAANTQNTSPDFTFQAFQAAEVWKFQYNKHYMSDEFLRDAEIRGDTMYGCVNPGTDQLISYGWYTRKPCDVNNGVRLHFSDQYFYMYNGYTEPAYRGYRLHGIGMAQFAMKTKEYGKKGLVSYILAENYRSIRSCTRLGYQFVGYALSMRFLGKNFFYITPGAKAYHIDLETIQREPAKISATSQAA